MCPAPRDRERQPRLEDEPSVAGRRAERDAGCPAAPTAGRPRARCARPARPCAGRPSRRPRSTDVRAPAPTARLPLRPRPAETRDRRAACAKAGRRRPRGVHGAPWISGWPGVGLGAPGVAGRQDHATGSPSPGRPNVVPPGARRGTVRPDVGLLPRPGVRRWPPGCRYGRRRGSPRRRAPGDVRRVTRTAGGAPPCSLRGPIIRLPGRTAPPPRPAGARSGDSARHRGRRRARPIH